MKQVLITVLILLLAKPLLADGSREEKQAKLDAACELAREKKLAPIRQQFVEECVVNGEQANREACERFYADYGARMGGRAPLFYDLPECVAAFEFLQGNENPGP